MNMKMCMCALIGAAGLVSSASAQTTLAEWTFETSIPVTAGPLPAEGGLYSGISSPASGFHAGASVYSNPVGNGTVESFSSTNWLVGDYYQFKTNASVHQDLTITWDQTSSTTGPRDWTLSVSTDGTLFTPVMDYSIVVNSAPNSWNTTTYIPIHTRSVPLPAILNSAPSIFVRLTQRTNIAANGTIVAATGTSRVDTVRIEGDDKIPAPGAAALLGLGGLMAARRRRA